MIFLTDYKNRNIRFTSERIKHLEENHPEMREQMDRIKETLMSPDCILESQSDPLVEMYYSYYNSTPVKDKYLCVVVKFNYGDNFVITSYFTDTIKKGELIWKKK